MDWNSCVGRGERGDLAHGDDGEDGLQRGDVVELFVDDLDGLEADVEVAGDATEVRGEEISRLRIEARHVSGVELARETALAARDLKEALDDITGGMNLKELLK